MKIYEGRDETGKFYGSGVMYFRIKDLASILKMIMSSEVIGDRFSEQLLFDKLDRNR